MIIIYILIIGFLGILIALFIQRKSQTNKEKYEEILLNKKIELIKLKKYKIDLSDSYWSYIRYDGMANYDMVSLSIKKGEYDERLINTYKYITIDGELYHYNIDNLQKEDKYIQLIFEQILEQNKIDKEQKEKEEFIQEEIDYAEKIKKLVEIEIKTSDKVKQEFKETFEKANRLKIITKEAIELMKEAKKIRKEF